MAGTCSLVSDLATGLYKTARKYAVIEQNPGSTQRPLVHAHAEALGQLAEAPIVVAQHLGHFGLSAARRLGALFCELLSRLGLRDRLRDRRGELVDDRLRRAVRYEDTAPADGVEARVAGFGKGRHVGQQR